MPRGRTGLGVLPSRQGVERVAVGSHDGEHVVGGLHAPLHLERPHSGVAHLGEAVHGAVVLGAEQARAAHPAALLGKALRGHARDLHHVAVLVDEVIRQAAGLGAEAPVGRAPAVERAHEAHARVAEAERPVAEALQLHALLRDAGDLRQRELARKGHAVDAPDVAAPRHAARVVHVGLRGDVGLHLRPPAADLRHEAPVLDDEGIRAELPRTAHEIEHARHLLGGDGDVHGHVDARPGEVGSPARRGERLVIEVVGAATGVEVVAQPAVDRVRPRGERGVERLGAAGGRQQLRHAVGLQKHGPSRHHAPPRAPSRPHPPELIRPVELSPECQLGKRRPERSEGGLIFPNSQTRAEPQPRPRPRVACLGPYTRRAQRFLPDWTVVPGEKSAGSTL